MHRRRIAGEQPDHGADQGGADGDDNSARDRGLGAGDQPREHIPTEVVGAEQVSWSRRGRAEHDVLGAGILRRDQWPGYRARGCQQQDAADESQTVTRGRRARSRAWTVWMIEVVIGLLLPSGCADRRPRRGRRR